MAERLARLWLTADAETVHAALAEADQLLAGRQRLDLEAAGYLEGLAMAHGALHGDDCPGPPERTRTRRGGGKGGRGA